MRVLVLGADGFVGRRVVAALALADWATPIAGVRRDGSATRRVLDATDEAAIAGVLPGIDAVVNCVTGDRRTIVRNAAALFAAARDRRIVHLSSMAVYGAATGRIDEDTPLCGRSDGYAAAKIAAERLARGVPNTVLLRPGCIYGAGSTQWSLRIARLLAEGRIGDLGAGGDGCSNIVHVDDVVAAILAALADAEQRGPFNLAMPDAPRWNGYFRAFAHALGTVPIRRIPAWRLDVEARALAVPLKLAESLTRRAPPPIPPSLVRFWRRDATLDSARATRALGIGWTPLDTGVAEAAYWCATRLGRRHAP